MSETEKTRGRLPDEEELQTNFKAMVYTISRLLQDQSESLLERIKLAELEKGRLKKKLLLFEEWLPQAQYDNTSLQARQTEMELEKGQIKGRLRQLENDKNDATTLQARLSEMETEMERMQLESHDAISRKHLDDYRANMKEKQLDLDECKATMESIVQVVVDEAGNEKTIRGTIDEKYTQLANLVQQTLRVKEASSPPECLQTMDALEVKVGELEKDVESEQAKLTCQICFDNERNVICLPCNHFLFCSLCISASRKRVKRFGRFRCPVCQTTISSVLDVYR